MSNPPTIGRLACSDTIPSLLVRVALLVVGCSSLTGCLPSAEIETTYGRRRGDGADSVNGTLVLASMFEQAGFLVSSWRRLSPKLEKEQVIVWAPDRFEVPVHEEIAYFETWLENAPGRTLVYVGRNYDGAIEYWEKLLEQTAGPQRLPVRQRWAQAKSAHVTRRQSESGSADCAWFSLDYDVPARRIRSVTGRLTDQGGEQPVDLQSGCELTPVAVSDDSEWVSTWDVVPLLSGGGRLLCAQLTRDRGNGSRIIVVADGSWLLNLPQVSHPNRRLAAGLIELCGPPGRACFLESERNVLEIAESDAELPLMLQLFTVWPINLFMLHLVLAGLIYCFYACPIFGRPRHLPDERLSDFGKHIAAVGELLERGQDFAYAKAQIDQYQEMTSSEPRG
jgi:hypothetical protein